MASSLDSKLTNEDLSTLIESIGYWESAGNYEYNLMQAIKRMPMPPEDHESYQYIINIKKDFASREKDLKASKEVRQEKAVFTKAKLLLARQEIGAGKLFDVAANVASLDNPESVDGSLKEEYVSKYGGSLEAAEAYMEDMNVVGFYKKFLDENGWLEKNKQ